MIGIGTRYSDFTTASKTAFRNPDVRFVNVNVADFDAAKQSGVRVVADARAALEQLAEALGGWSVDDDYRAEAARLNREWDAEVARLYSLGHEPLPAQSEVLGAVNDASAPRRRRRLRRRVDAGRPAQALADARSEGLPRRVRLLVHGLRDRRRARREAGGAGARGVRPRRRRVVPDAARASSSPPCRRA